MKKSSEKSNGKNLPTRRWGHVGKSTSNSLSRSSLKHKSTKFNYRDWHVSFADYLSKTHYFFLIPKSLRDIKAPIQHFIGLDNQ